MTDFETIDVVALEQVNGGLPPWLAAALRVAGRVGSKLVPFVNVASTAISTYEGASAYNDARAHGANVGESLWQGAKAFVVGR